MFEAASPETLRIGSGQLAHAGLGSMHCGARRRHREETG